MLERLEDLDTMRVRATMDRVTGITRKIALVENPNQFANIHLGDAIDLIVSAWDDVTSQTILNCFCHSRIKTLEDEYQKTQGQISEEELDPAAVLDAEQTQALLGGREHSSFRDYLDIRALLKKVDDEMGMEEDHSMTDAQLLAADEYEDESLSPEESVEEPIITRDAAKACLQTLKKYIQLQEDDLAPELASVRSLMNFVEAKRILTLQQTTIDKYFRLN
ncbi:hypothetical protein BGZ75_000453 [Mortierella antarctica]|nr:hypothetical protein BGZ75_000453 [Mortierella antarctica]